MNTIQSNIDLMLAMRGSYGRDIDEMIIRFAVHIESAQRHLAAGLPAAAARHHRDAALELARNLKSDFGRDGVPAVSDLAFTAIYKLEAENAAALLRTFGDTACAQCGATIKGVAFNDLGALCWHCSNFDEKLEQEHVAQI